MSVATNDRSSDLGKLVLRVAVGGLLLFHGVAKLQHGVAWIAAPLGRIGLPGFVAYGVYLGEVVAPLLLLAGWRTRLAALVVAFNMAMALLLSSRAKFFSLTSSGGWAVELAMFFLLGALALFLLGAGRYSVSRGGGRWD